MSLIIKRLGSSDNEPHTLEVQSFLLRASSLLWHMAALEGLIVLAKKSFAMTDEFGAYFVYKNRLIVMETPFSLINISMLGSSANETLFIEVEEHVKKYDRKMSFFGPIAFLRYLPTPANLPLEVFSQYGATVPGGVK